MFRPAQDSSVWLGLTSREQCEESVGFQVTFLKIETAVSNDYAPNQLFLN